MSEFSRFATAVRSRFDQMAKQSLYVVDISGDALWAAYLAAFPKGTNPVFRERTEHDCSCCRNFIKNLGTVVTIENNKLKSVWDLEGLEYPYDVVAAQLKQQIESDNIAEIFVTKETFYGLERNHEMIDGKPHVWHHFYGVVPRKCISSTPGKVKGDTATTVEVFKRGLTELTKEAVDTILELITSNSVYRGEEHLKAVKEFSDMQQKYAAIVDEQEKSIYLWKNVASPAARFRNTVIGTLVQDLSANVPMETAVRMFETKVAPANYKRSSALITPSMVKSAMEKVAELGLESAIARRFATIHDVSVNNVLWVDNAVKGQMKNGLAGLLEETITKAPVKPIQAHDIGIDAFMSSVLPLAKSIEVFVTNAMQPNFMSLTAPVDSTSGNLFKWANQFGWSYSGNVTDSIKEKVKRAGGNTNAKLRVSLAWFNGDDLDIHCECPSGHIYFGNKKNILDVDMNAGGARNSTDPVENLSWSSLVDGKYNVYVRQFCQRSSMNPGFVIELENEGTITQFSYSRAVKDIVDCITFKVVNGKVTNLAVDGALNAQGIQQEKWGVNTEQFVKVDTVMFSPNYWDDQAVGNKHWFFILNGCINDEPTRGIYNEYLTSSLETHRKVFEVLGNKTLCAPSQHQLSGVGFSSTRKDTIMVRVHDGKKHSVYNVSF